MAVETFDIEKVKFDEKGLVPCIVQDVETKRVLTLAYMNRESLRITLEKGLTCFWSRSRQALWLKGGDERKLPAHRDDGSGLRL